jgi:hypothetical protein
MLKQKIKDLPKIDRDTLMDAFNSETSLMVRIEDNEYIGVNLIDNPEMTEIERCGVWSYGTITTNSPR